MPGVGTIIDAACWGALFGGISGYHIGKAHGATGGKMLGYIAGGALIGGVAGYAGVSLSATFTAGLAGFEAAATGGLITGMTSGAINSAGMTMLAGGNASEIFGNGVQGLMYGAITGMVGGLAHHGTGYLMDKIDLLNNFNPALKILRHMTTGKNPLYNTVSYMAGSTASQMTSNLLNGNNIFDNVDYGLNPGILIPLTADIAPRFKSVREYYLNKQYSSEKYTIKKVQWISQSGRINDNGDLNIHTVFSAEYTSPEWTHENFFGKTIVHPEQIRTTALDYNPIMSYNFIGLIRTLFNLYSN